MHAVPFKAEQRYFIFHAAAVAREPVACTDNAVARDDQADRIPADCTPDGLRGHFLPALLPCKPGGDVAVRHQFPERNGNHDIGNSFSERRQFFHSVRRGKIRLLPGKIDVQPAAAFLKNRQVIAFAGAAARGLAARLYEAQLCQDFAVGTQHHVVKLSGGTVYAEVHHLS